MIEHASPAIESNEAHSEAFFGDDIVLLLVFDDVFDVGEFPGGGEAEDGDFVVSVAAAKLG